VQLGEREADSTGERQPLSRAAGVLDVVPQPMTQHDFDPCDTGSSRLGPVSLGQALAAGTGGLAQRGGLPVIECLVAADLQRWVVVLRTTVRLRTVVRLTLVS
jgi:hypothetical protein